MEFLASYPAKLVEYTLGVVYLLLFLWFWRYVQGSSAQARHEAHAGLPDGVLLHPGHTWAREEPDGLVEVGADEFAARLVGPVERLELPLEGAAVRQGAPAAALVEHGRRVALVSPVDGVVVDVSADPSRWDSEPYGAWLFRVRPTHYAQDRDQLLIGDGARAYEAREEQALQRETADVPHDGRGLADTLPPERWDALCREHFRC